MKILPWSIPLSNVDINNIIQQIPQLLKYFRGVFSRDEILPLLKKPKNIECSILNLDTRNGPGSHWTAYFKIRKNIYYYDSFGNLPPPKELLNYFKEKEIFYNRNREQEFNTIVCGHLCLCFLYKVSCNLHKL